MKSNNLQADATQPEAVDVTEPEAVDVTEPVSNAPAPIDMIDVQPMKALPKAAKGLIATYPGAKGFTVEASGAYALHF